MTTQEQHTMMNNMTIEELEAQGAHVEVSWSKKSWKTIPGRWRYNKSYWYYTYINGSYKYIWIEGYWWFDKPRWVWM